ncbi:hypothetical protein E2F43_18730 [Seongchinamella unica]|uniref:Uncharacterized protein n=1 Tax=Seongchinamella unica TaxID=2547392 RepID=A0A4R5LMZ2_9GAMM|nr:hypothetical protein [Seongchinamella unica]TDG11418.1 hypothetical protein E2F43_18730 [Seongchinamella unica]
MLTLLRRLLLTGLFLTLLATNILTLTSVAFNAAVSGLISSALGIQTVTGMMNQRLAGKDKMIRQQKTSAAKRKVAVRKFGSRLSARTRRVATRSIAAIPGEAIPYLGVAVLIAGTSYELYEACESLRDLETLYAELGLDDKPPEATLSAVCDPQLPDAGEVWEQITSTVDGYLGSE